MEKCRNCGAPLASDGGECRYCHYASATSSVNLERLAGALAQAAEEERGMLEALAERLERGFPGLARIDRRGLLGGKKVGRVSLDTGEWHYEATAAGSGVETSITHTVGGIRLQTERLPAGQWLDRLAAELASHVNEKMAGHRGLGQI